MRHKILIIDDDTSLAEMIALHYEDQDYYVDVCNSLSETAKKNFNDYDIILLDHHLTDGFGLAFLKNLKSRKVSTPIIMMTGKHDMDLAIEALRVGALDYVHKPLDMDSLDTLISNHIKSQDLRKSENVLPLSPLNTHTLTPKIVGSHPEVLEAIKKIALTSNNTSSVLIYGELGTGKTLASQVIHHYFSNESSYTFIQSGSQFSIPEHAKFLIIEDVESLTNQEQAKLLSWILIHEQDAPKIISLSRKSPQELQGILSDGLCQKLFDTHIHMPPLNERASDIPALAQHILNQLIYTLNSPVRGIEQGTLTFLEGCNWPNNVLELNTVLSVALQSTKSSVIEKRTIERAIASVQKAAEKQPVHKKTADSTDHNLQSMEEKTIYDTLYQNKGHKSKSASDLGISRPALDRKIAKYNINVQKIKQSLS